jgi:hypothetical protein
MPETDNIPETNNKPEDESENKAEMPESNSDDDYFEKVNLRLKKKSRFSFNRPSKKTPSSKDELSPNESKDELPPDETGKQMQNIETSDDEQPSMGNSEQQPTANDNSTLVAESDNKPQLPEKVKPKKRSIFNFNFRRNPKVPPADKIPSTESNNAMPPSESCQPQILETNSQLQPAIIDSEKQPVASSNNLAEDSQVNPPDTSLANPPVNQPDSPSEKLPNVPSESPPENPPTNPPPSYSEGIESIGKYAPKLASPKKAVLCIGEYPIHILLKGRLASKPEDVLPFFIDKSSLDIVKWSRKQLDPNSIIGLDAELDTHFWYNIIPSVTSDDKFISRLKNKPIEKLQAAIIVASTWDGIGSALLPTLISQFNEWKINSIALAFFPSKVQPIESQFNAFAAIGTSVTKDSATLVLVDRDNLESYIGVDRNGNMITGNAVANYLLDLMLSKETLVQELSEISKTFSSKLYTIFLATGASFKIYGSIGNMLDTTLFKPLFTFDLSSASLLYVLVRIPYQLKEKLPRAKIEMAVANWFKDKATLKSINVAEPIYVEEASDRIDIALFIGGFETAKMFASLEKKVNAMKNQAVKNGFIKEEDWQAIVKNLTE